MRIVVGIDDSEMGEEALTRALDLVERLGDAQLDVVHVTHLPATVLAAMSGVPMATEDFAEAQRGATWDRVASILSGHSVDARTVDIEGYPADELVDYAASVGADLLVVGSRGRGQLASLLLGSTSNRVVNHAPCDVLVVRHREEG
jgi:nucleotide-binding universal stress UspA family protein